MDHSNAPTKNQASSHTISDLSFLEMAQVLTLFSLYLDDHPSLKKEQKDRISTQFSGVGWYTEKEGACNSFLKKELESFLIHSAASGRGNADAAMCEKKAIILLKVYEVRNIGTEDEQPVFGHETTTHFTTLNLYRRDSTVFIRYADSLKRESDEQSSPRDKIPDTIQSLLSEKGIIVEDAQEDFKSLKQERPECGYYAVYHAAKMLGVESTTTTMDNFVAIYKEKLRKTYRVEDSLAPVKKEETGNGVAVSQVAAAKIWDELSDATLLLDDYKDIYKKGRSISTKEIDEFLALVGRAIPLLSPSDVFAINPFKNFIERLPQEMKEANKYIATALVMLDKYLASNLLTSTDSTIPHSSKDRKSTLALGELVNWKKYEEFLEQGSVLRARFLFWHGEILTRTFINPQQAMQYLMLAARELEGIQDDKALEITHSLPNSVNMCFAPLIVDLIPTRINRLKCKGQEKDIIQATELLGKSIRFYWYTAMKQEWEKANELRDMLLQQTSNMPFPKDPRIPQWSEYLKGCARSQIPNPLEEASLDLPKLANPGASLKTERRQILQSNMSFQQKQEAMYQLLHTTFEACVSDAVHWYGLPKTHFVVVYCGSFARKEVTPYSDIDYLILHDTLENMQPHERGEEYKHFQSLVNWIKLQVIKIGEEYPYDPSLKMGFRSDSLHAPSFNTGKDPYYCGTVEQILSNLASDPSKTALYDVRICFASNSEAGERIVGAYYSALGTYLREHKSSWLDYLEDDLKKVDEYRAQLRDAGSIDIKEHMLRFPQLVTHRLACYQHIILPHNATYCSTIAKLDELIRLKAIAPEAGGLLKEWFQLAQELRYYLQQKAQCEDDTVSVTSFESTLKNTFPLLIHFNEYFGALHDHIQQAIGHRLQNPADQGMLIGSGKNLQKHLAHVTAKKAAIEEAKKAEQLMQRFSEWVKSYTPPRRRDQNAPDNMGERKALWYLWQASRTSLEKTLEKWGSMAEEAGVSSSQSHNTSSNMNLFLETELLTTANHTNPSHIVDTYLAHCLITEVSRGHYPFFTKLVESGNKHYLVRSKTTGKESLHDYIPSSGNTEGSEDVDSAMDAAAVNPESFGWVFVRALLLNPGDDTIQNYCVLPLKSPEEQVCNMLIAEDKAPIFLPSGIMYSNLDSPSPILSVLFASTWMDKPLDHGVNEVLKSLEPVKVLEHCLSTLQALSLHIQVDLQRYKVVFETLSRKLALIRYLCREFPSEEEITPMQLLEEIEPSACLSYQAYRKEKQGRLHSFNNRYDPSISVSRSRSSSVISSKSYDNNTSRPKASSSIAFEDLKECIQRNVEIETVRQELSRQNDSTFRKLKYIEDQMEVVNGRAVFGKIPQNTLWNSNDRLPLPWIMDLLRQYPFDRLSFKVHRSNTHNPNLITGSVLSRLIPTIMDIAAYTSLLPFVPTTQLTYSLRWLDVSGTCLSEKRLRFTVLALENLQSLYANAMKGDKTPYRRLTIESQSIQHLVLRDNSELSYLNPTDCPSLTRLDVRGCTALIERIRWSLWQKQPHIQYSILEGLEKGIYEEKAGADALTPLLYHVKHGNARKVSELLRAHAIMTAHDSRGCTPLYVAVEENQRTVVAAFLEYHFINSTTFLIDDGLLAQEIATFVKSHNKSLRRAHSQSAAEHKDAELDRRYEQPEEAKKLKEYLVGDILHNVNRYFIFERYKKKMEQFLQSQKDGRLSCPFQLAIKNGPLSIVDTFLEYHASLNHVMTDLPNGQDKLPLFLYACAYGKLDLVKGLVRHGVARLYAREHVHHSLDRAIKKANTSQNNRANGTQQVATKPTQIATIRAQKNRMVEIEDCSSETFLVTAAPVRFAHDEDRKKKVEHVLKSCAHDENGRTHIHLAARHGQTAVLKFLLDEGVDVDTKDNNNMTAMHIACSYGFIEAARLLIERGASQFAKDKNGKSPIERAIIKDRDTLVLSLPWSKEVDSVVLARDYGKNELANQLESKAKKMGLQPKPCLNNIPSVRPTTTEATPLVGSQNIITSYSST